MKREDIYYFINGNEDNIWYYWEDEYLNNWRNRNFDYIQNLKDIIPSNVRYLYESKFKTQSYTFFNYEDCIQFMTHPNNCYINTDNTLFFSFYNFGILQESYSMNIKNSLCITFTSPIDIGCVCEQCNNWMLYNEDFINTSNEIKLLYHHSNTRYIETSIILNVLCKWCIDNKKKIALYQELYSKVNTMLKKKIIYSMFYINAMFQTYHYYEPMLKKEILKYILLETKQES